MKMKWKMERIDWHKHGLCWRWSRITKRVFYSGNQVQISWGRIAFVFERREWIHCENVLAQTPPTETPSTEHDEN